MTDNTWETCDGADLRVEKTAMQRCRSGDSGPRMLPPMRAWMAVAGGGSWHRKRRILRRAGGPHKTGSISIRKMLEDTPERLVGAGLVDPDAGMGCMWGYHALAAALRRGQFPQDWAMLMTLPPGKTGQLPREDLIGSESTLWLLRSLEAAVMRYRQS